MTTGTHTQLLADLFASHGLESRIALRLADNENAAIRIWPYAVSQDRATRNQSLSRASDSGPLAVPRDHSITHALVLPSTIDVYDQARRIVFDNPVLMRGETRTRVLIETMALADVTALFLASRAEYVLALAVALDDA